MKQFLFSACGAVLLILISAGCVSEDISRKAAKVPVIPDAEYIGDLACLDCHYEMEESFDKTIHGRIADFEVVGSKKGCESCHGPGSLHEASEDPADIICFDYISKGESAAVCLSCHRSGTLMNWQGSGHALGNVACTDCHTAHSREDNLLISQQPGMCYDCHKSIRAKTYYPSHHPIKEGKMDCSDCHQPHGGVAGNLKTAERTNDLCLDCHASKQGPFIFEHAPVVEDCAICHDAHGTVANNLLVQNEPFLCLQCHQFHFHPGKVAVEGDVTDIYDRNIHSCSEGMTKSYTTKCTQCHPRIHGSDQPSQSVPGQGKALTR
ncbi:MAG: GSU2203 family decaheme c-type cytochrome [Desulfobacteraceae bacterium]